MRNIFHVHIIIYIYIYEELSPHNLKLLICLYKAFLAEFSQQKVDFTWAVLG